MHRNPTDPALWALVLAGVAIWLSLGRLNEQRRLFDLIREVRAEFARETALAKEIKKEVPKEASPLSPQMRNGQLVPCLGTWCVGDMNTYTARRGDYMSRTVIVAGHASMLFAGSWLSEDHSESEREETLQRLNQELRAGGWEITTTYTDFTSYYSCFTNETLPDWSAEVRVYVEGATSLGYNAVPCEPYMTLAEAQEKIDGAKKQEVAGQEDFL